MSANKVRIYGNPPYKIALIHGGPGAAGEMAQVAEELASHLGILEPFQTASSIDGQIIELKEILEEKGDLPTILVGYSWGAWLSIILTVTYPQLVRKLILIGCGPFEGKYSDWVSDLRFNRLSPADKIEVNKIAQQLKNPDHKIQRQAFTRLGTIYSELDAFDPIAKTPCSPKDMDFQYNIFKSVWHEAAELRKNGHLLRMLTQLKCPVTAIHGDYDPHPAEGVQKPMAVSLENFKFYLLENCGHKPWIENQAREKFFKILKNEIQEHI
jgi:pimeloyl-ACP methyl ester carboxylesterase